MSGPGRKSKHSKRGIIAGVILVAVIASGILWLRRPVPEPPPRFTGYVVSDNVYMSSPVAGMVASVAVVRGQRVAVGTPLFRMEPTSLVARADQRGRRWGRRKPSCSRASRTWPAPAP
ncbi:biotin/lipoyl-binding protein, partial [Corallococcus sp. 4LFB]|uniref:biotin/lipoyl-binding protein n=1 Tax=Corallococcus sp. 4LFB TaxID=3383249 RepID=UPI0039765B05